MKSQTMFVERVFLTICHKFVAGKLGTGSRSTWFEAESLVVAFCALWNCCYRLLKYPLTNELN
jgi:hypothetical protein